jgi:photosystem II stability/assembly factor-like uncharacterized protein
MKTFFILNFILISVSIIYAQISPDHYKLHTGKNNLNKISSLSPLSNTITDIITVGDTVWLGTSKGVSLSTDNGTTWSNFYGQSDFGTDNISAIGYNKGTFWCATAKSTEITGGEILPEGTGLKYTTNLGATWQSVPQSVDIETDTLEMYGINQIAALPVTVGINNLAYDIAFTKNTIWIATFAGGLRKSTDNGSTWDRVVLPPDFLNEISPDDTLNFCLSPVDGNFCSNGNLNHRVFSITSVNDTTLYVGSANGINKSTDNGISWKKFNAQNQTQAISGNFVTALGYNQITQSVWASTWKAEDENEFYGVSASTDGGETWNTFLRDERPHNFGFKGNEVLAATDNGVFRSNNSSGTSWTLPNSIIDETSDPNTKFELQTNEFYSVASNNFIWLGSTDGLVRLQETSNWQGTWKIFFVAQTLSSNTDSYCYPNPFNPRQEALKIKYSTGGVDADVTIRVFDFSFNYVRTIIQNVQRNRDVDSPPDFWDGKDDDGSFVPNGVYFYRVDVDDKDPVYGKILVIQ